MKKLIILILTSLVGTQLMAQPRDFSAQCKSEMKKLAYFVGDWKGTAVIQTPNGPQTLVQTEHIKWELDGVVLSIEGIGRENDKVTFNALAFVNFNPASQEFQFRSYLKEGYATDAYFKVLDTNKFEWGFDIPSGGKVKYSITLDPVKKTWYELGQYSPDGTQWMKSIEMNLVKL
ncbi:MAG: hypothetical protein RIF39_04515 [Cyclobacteriaceae bacterium]